MTYNETLKYAWRFLMRSKSYTVINLVGLAFSLACCIMLMRYIHRELTVDTHCVDRNHVYGVIQDMDGNRGMATIENTNKDSIYIDHRYIEKRTSFNSDGTGFCERRNIPLHSADTRSR